MSEITYELGNGVERNKENPETFYIPSDKVKQALSSGMLAKLMFEPTDPNAQIGGERMWVLVIEDNYPDFLGALRNNPVMLDDLEYGDLVEFTADHVIDVTVPGPVLEAIRVLSEEL
ncbi:hypothetical protein SEA_BIG4_145 [Microbacterium phage Big4]|nr:hypothetical protein SEA_BIG4_145 [Microbacterium phage Big4]